MKKIKIYQKAEAQSFARILRLEKIQTEQMFCEDFEAREDTIEQSFCEDFVFRVGATEEVYTVKGRQAEVSDRGCNTL